MYRRSVEEGEEQVVVLELIKTEEKELKEWIRRC